MKRLTRPGAILSPAAIAKRLILIGACVLTLMPLVWLISASLSAKASLFAAPLFPQHMTLVNYSTLFHQTSFLLWLKNSIIVCIGGSLLALGLTTSMGYAFARLRFRGRRVGLLTLFLLQMIPSAITVIAIYYILSKVGLLNTFIGLILVYAGTNIPFSAWLLKGFFDSISVELEEAAFVDGATRWQAVTRVLLPIAAPMMAAVFLFNVIAFYNDYVLASVILSGTDNYTIGLGLRFFQSAQGADWALFSAGAIAGALPLVAIFYGMQRYLVGGLAAGAIKG